MNSILDRIKNVIKKHWLKLTVLALSIVLIELAWIYSYSLREHVTKKNYPARNIDRITDYIETLDLKYDVIGRVNYYNKSYPVIAVNSGAPESKFNLCVFSGTHGDEPAGVEASLSFMSEIVHDSTYSNINISIIPIINPWGWVHNIRRNGDIKDVNRSYINEPTQEAKLVKKFISQKKCTMVVDLHEDRLHKSFYVLTYGDVNLASTKNVAKEIGLTGVALGGSSSSGVYHSKESAFSDVSKPTLSLYSRMNNVLYAYIIETPRELDMNKRVNLHLSAMRALIKNAVFHANTANNSIQPNAKASAD